jgi:DNA-binding MarR family transcriptional regulator
METRVHKSIKSQGPISLFEEQLPDIKKTVRVKKYLDKHKEGRTHTQIADDLGYSRSLVLSILDPLEKRGVVYTSRDDGAKARYYSSGRDL